MPPPPTECRRLSVCSINLELMYRLLTSARPFVGPRNVNPLEAASSGLNPVRRTDSVFSYPRFSLYDSELLRSNVAPTLPRMRLRSALSLTKANIAPGLRQYDGLQKPPSRLHTGRGGRAI